MGYSTEYAKKLRKELRKRNYTLDRTKGSHEIWKSACGKAPVVVNVRLKKVVMKRILKEI